MADVRARGDAALLEYTRRFDGWDPGTAAGARARPGRDACRLPVAPGRGPPRPRPRGAPHHRASTERERDAEVPSRRDAAGATLAQVVRPLARVGLYVPGGTARYPSSVLMTAIPARVAGVREVVACSPGVRGTGEMDAWTLAACHVAGRLAPVPVGGAQAVAALAYGTATIPAVDKICGPGNAYVAAAKRLVFGQVDIDMIAGPSEILVLADAEGRPRRGRGGPPRAGGARRAGGLGPRHAVDARRRPGDGGGRAAARRSPPPGDRGGLDPRSRRRRGDEGPRRGGDRSPTSSPPSTSPSTPGTPRRS